MLPTAERIPNLVQATLLRDYQWEDVDFLLGRKSGLLADEMGLGKTVQVSVALSLLYKNYDAARALIVVPASLGLNWEREIRRWAPRLSVRRVEGPATDRLYQYRLPYKVQITSYEQLRVDARRLSSLVRFGVVVLDESQRIKNADSSTALACRIISRDRSWALTGTAKTAPTPAERLIYAMRLSRLILLALPTCATSISPATASFQSVVRPRPTSSLASA